MPVNSKPASQSLGITRLHNLWLRCPVIESSLNEKDDTTDDVLVVGLLWYEQMKRDAIPTGEGFLWAWNPGSLEPLWQPPF
jgi:hypothetical protein